MKTGKKVALALGLAAGALVTIFAIGKTGKKARGYVAKKASEVYDKARTHSTNQDDEISYI